MTELGNFGTDTSGYTESFAVAINDVGAAVGSATRYDGAGTSLGVRPVYCGLDGMAVDLNTLIDPCQRMDAQRSTSRQRHGLLLLLPAAIGKIARRSRIGSKGEKLNNG
ncbi:MAG: hypothetical protein H0T51_12330 [Pirellulales bacterium]|nr:hypothetical protein [Pirellulales bacterium]